MPTDQVKKLKNKKNFWNALFIHSAEFRSEKKFCYQSDAMTCRLLSKSVSKNAILISFP